MDKNGKNKKEYYFTKGDGYFSGVGEVVLNIFNQSNSAEDFKKGMRENRISYDKQYPFSKGNLFNKDTKKAFNKFAPDTDYFYVVIFIENKKYIYAHKKYDVDRGVDYIKGVRTKNNWVENMLFNSMTFYGEEKINMFYSKDIDIGEANNE
jgi:hypothetical protein